MRNVEGLTDRLSDFELRPELEVSLPVSESLSQAGEAKKDKHTYE